jgi:hypothetical protein
MQSLQKTTTKQKSSFIKKGYSYTQPAALSCSVKSQKKPGSHKVQLEPAPPLL